MDKKKTEFMNALDRFMKKIRKVIKVDKFVLFGSRATGNYRKDSDIDLIILSKDFEKIKYFKRSPQLYLLWDAPQDIDIICLTPTEFAKKIKEIGVVRQALKEGIEL